MNKFLRIAFVLALATQSLGCAQFLNSLRRGVDDGPAPEASTVGGRWHERGFFDPNRAPASMPSEGNGSADTWVSSAQSGATQRDTLRGSDMYSQNPNLPPTTERAYKNGMRATRADFIDDHPSEGSLWSSSGQTNYYLTKNKIRAVGDILTINMDESLLKDVTTEIKRGLDINERDAEVADAQERFRRKALGIPEPGAKPGETAAAPAPAARTPASADGERAAEAAPEPEIPVATAGDIDLSKSIELKAGEPMMAEIVERYPNGNYKVRGIKRVLYKNGAPRLVTLVGIAKSSDVTEEDVLNSGKLYEYRIEAHR